MAYGSPAYGLAPYGKSSTFTLINSTILAGVSAPSGATGSVSPAQLAGRVSPSEQAGI